MVTNNPYNFREWQALQDLPMTWGPGAPSRNDEMVNQYMRGDPRRYYNFRMPSTYSPRMQEAYGASFNDVYGEYENQINQQAKQTGQLPTTSFDKWLDKFDFGNWYAGKQPINNRYNFASGLRWF